MARTTAATLPTPSRRRLLALIGATACAAATNGRRAAAAGDAAPQAVTQAGTVAGLWQGSVRAFLGVPYAAPPLGSLRFRPPAPPVRWSAVRPAQESAAAPIQAPMPGLAATSEDCLYLNIWAPADGAGHPVLVWLHGGGNVAGWAGQKSLDGAAFARDGVVCVTVGYRLGAFGFLELGGVLGEAYAGSGSNGLRDQAAALAWVRDNIAAFGGDPGRVTLAGQSAGAKDVCALLAVPAAAGLFQRAIIESGSGQTVFTPAQARDVAKQFVAAAGSAALAGMPAADLLAAENRVVATAPIDFPFRPVIDGAFLPRRPVDAVAAGSAAGVALLLGSNADESVLFVGPEDAARAIPQAALSNLDAAAFAGREPAYRAALPALSGADLHWRMLTAEEYWIPTLRVAEAQVAAGGAAWMYRFDIKAAGGRFAGRTVHAAELPSVWGLPGAALPAMHAAWVRFIGGAAPGAAGWPDWPRFDTAQRRTMILDSAPHVMADPRGAERQVWAGVL